MQTTKPHRWKKAIWTRCPATVAGPLKKKLSAEAVHQQLSDPMRALLLVFAVYCFHGRSSALTSQTSQAVAIIGAGIGGTSTAFFLRQRLGNTSGIEMYSLNRFIEG